MRHQRRSFQTFIEFARANVVLTFAKAEVDVPDDKFQVAVLMTENADGDGWIADVLDVKSWDGEKWTKDNLSLAEKLQIEQVMVDRQERIDAEDELLEEA